MKLTSIHFPVCQLLQGRLSAKYLDPIELGSGDTDMVFSGQCDDEDGCRGSGDGDGETRIVTPSECEYKRHPNCRSS